MASLYVIRGKDNGQHFAIRGVNATIGRESTNQIQLHDTEVSRTHAKIARSGPSQFEIFDCNSSNGTFVNSRRVKSQVLRSGDRVQVGRSLLIFTGGPEPYSSAVAEAVEIVSSAAPNDLSQIRSSLQSHGALVPPSSSHSASPLSGSIDTGPLESDAQKPEQISNDSSDAESQLPFANSDPQSNWEIVYQVGQAINRTTDLNELLTQVLDLIFKWISCDRGCILMIDDHSGKLAPICSRDRKHTGASEGSAKPITISRTILEHVISTKEGVLTGNAQDDSRWQEAESVNSLGVREAICVPMLGRYGLVGAIYVDTSMSAGVLAERKGESSFDENHLKLMVAISGQAALAIEDTQFYRAMMQAERLAVMGQTIANLSHHVKNILQGVGGGNYLVESGLKKNDLDVVRKGWGIVQRNQARITNLVMDMLSFSKEREPNLTLQDLRELVDDVVEMMQARSADQGVSLQWTRPENPVNAEYDEEGIHRAVLNVLTNAIDAASDKSKSTSGDGQVSIEVSVNDGNVCIIVGDNGCGIDPEDQSKIFSPFESTKGSQGTGLGLPVSKKILTEHGGDIELESQVNRGTVFILSWPAGQHRDGSATLRGE